MLRLYSFATVKNRNGLVLACRLYRADDSIKRFLVFEHVDFCRGLIPSLPASVYLESMLRKAQDLYSALANVDVLLDTGWSSMYIRRNICRGKVPLLLIP